MSACKVMGIVNVTPDSFSDGGKYFTAEEAVRRARNMVAEGADIVDIGGESTRPGATPVGWEEEWRRIGEVLKRLRDLPVPVSVDTYHPETAERAIALGAKMINCVYAEPVPRMLEIASGKDVELVVPAKCADIVPDLSKVYLDPMIGFGTTREEDLELLASVKELAGRARVLVGASRKRIVKRMLGVKASGKDLGGNLAIAIWCAMNGVSAIRVHDVGETVRALRVVDALAGRRLDAPAE
ncbi:MAG: dihydropteroate synthase [Kiritimatiellae bacterium]|nr:dihydropteroate synthase [Kiritimatiellia bacterium]